MATQSSIPAIEGVPIVDKDGHLSLDWWQFFVALWQRTGASLGSGLPVNPTAANQVLTSVSQTTLLWVGLNGAYFAKQNANAFLIGPAAGVANTPSFRFIAAADLSPLDGQYPGTTDGANANAGNIGEVISSSIASGAGVVLATGVTSDITSINLGIGDWDIWGSIGLTAASTSTSAWINQASAADPGAPNGGAYLQQDALTTASIFPLGMQALTLVAPATLYLSAKVAFGAACNGYGFLGARRRR